MIEIKDMKESLQDLQTTVLEGTAATGEDLHLEIQDDMLPEDYRYTLDEAISSLCEDICQHSDAGDNLKRANAIKTLAEACTMLDSLQPVHEPEPADPLTWLQNLKDHCKSLRDCDDCPIGESLCEKTLTKVPQDWDLEGEA